MAENGKIFGTGGSGFIRMNIACPQAVLKKALQQMEQVLQSRKFRKKAGVPKIIVELRTK